MREPPQLPDGQKGALMRQIKRLAEIFDKCTDPRYNRSSLYRSNGPSPWDNQTANGLYLELSGGKPCRLWTPWGSWPFAVRSGRNNDETRRFMSYLTVDAHALTCAIGRNMEVDGPVFPLLVVDGVLLPRPVLCGSDWYPPIADTRDDWDRFFEADLAASEASTIELYGTVRRSMAYPEFHSHCLWW